MELRDATLLAVAGIITGDDQRSAYRTGAKVERFLGRFGQVDPYPGGTYSRVRYTVEVLEGFRGTNALARAVAACVDPADYLNTGFSADTAVAYLNEYLAFDGYELVRRGRDWTVVVASKSSVSIEALVKATDPLTHEFIHEQLDKCERKLGEGDHDGAITNARALLEAVLREVESRVTGSTTDTKGDLAKHYKAVQKLLHLEPDRKDIDGSLRQMLSGLVSIVHGVSAARNSMSDAHARTYRPSAHHARLVVNAAQTLADFLLASYEAQRERGMLDDGGSGP